MMGPDPSQERANATASPLFGRDDDLRRLVSLLERSDVAWVTITGVAGVGKSSLARVVTTLPAVQQMHHVVAVDLREIPAADLLPVLVAEELAKAETSWLTRPDVGPIAADRPALCLIMDHGEHLPDLGSMLNQLIASNRLLRIVMCARQPWGIAGEEVVRLSPLAVRSPWPGMGVPSPAEQLIRHHLARLANHTLELDVAKILQLSQGLPQLIETLVSFPEVVVHLEQQIATGSLPALEDRLHEAVRLAYHALTPGLQQALIAIAIVMPAIAVRSVTKWASVTTGNIAELCRRRLVEHEPGSIKPTSVVSMCAQVRAVALQEASAQARQPWDTAYQDWIIATFQLADHYLDGEALDERDYSRLRHLTGHLRHVLFTLLQDGHHRDYVALFSQLDWFWITRTNVQGAVYWLEQIEPSVSALLPTLDATERIQALHAIGRINLYRQDLLASLSHLADALRLSLTSTHHYRTARVLSDLGQCLTQAGHIQAALRCHRQVLRLGERLENAELRSRALTQVGACHAFEGDFSRAEDALEEAVALARSLDNTSMLLARPLHYLGYVYSHTDRFAQGRQAFEESIAIQALCNMNGALWAKQLLGRLELMDHQIETAAGHLAMVLVHRVIRDDRRYVRQLLVDTAWTSFLMRDPLRCAQLLGAAGIGIERRRQLNHAGSVATMIDGCMFQLGAAEFSAAYARGGQTSYIDASIAALHYLLTLAAKQLSASLVLPRDTSRLSSREQEVLDELALGKTDREIAESLGIAPSTASTHVKRLLRKLGAPTRTAAVTIAGRRGLLSDPDQ